VISFTPLEKTADPLGAADNDRALSTTRRRATKCCCSVPDGTHANDSTFAHATAERVNPHPLTPPDPTAPQVPAGHAMPQSPPGGNLHFDLAAEKLHPKSVPTHAFRFISTTSRSLPSLRSDPVTPQRCALMIRRCPRYRTVGESVIRRGSRKPQRCAPRRQSRAYPGIPILAAMKLR
jgi:hypothetical protein